MTRDSRMFRKFGSVLTTATFFAMCAVPGVSQQHTFVDGLWARENTIVLFARFEQCGGPYRPAQPIVSTDGGNTWAADGPRFEGGELLYMLSDGADLLIAGQEYAEGATSSPFMLTYNFDQQQWSQSEIYGGDAELLGMAREEQTGHLLAWVTHIDIQSDDDSELIFLHESVDGGKNWEVVKNVTHVPTSIPGMRFFGALPQRSGKWRLGNAGNAIEQSRDDGKWHSTVKLPMEIQQQCPESQGDTRP